MNFVDSSGWLEYFANATNADFFAPVIEDTSYLIVPSISLTEVFKVVYLQRGENAALQVCALMQQGQIVPLDETLSIAAAKLGVELKLPLADSIILATAGKFNAILWTQDDDFEGIEGVKYIPKK